MTRTKIIDGVIINLTAEEETARDAEEKEWADGKPRRDAIEKIYQLESTVTPRRIRAMTTDDGKKWIDDVEKLIAVERGKL